MNLQITDAGVAALQSNSGPLVLNAFRLGSAVNYIPLPTDTDIHGSVIWSGVPTPPIALTANLYKYSVYLDYDLGPFDFGEIALDFAGPLQSIVGPVFIPLGAGVSNGLFALGAANNLIHKEPVSNVGSGNSIRIDLYLSMVGTNYSMWLDLAESNNGFRMAILESVDYLPMSQNATPNAYIIKGATASQSAVMAYTDRNSFWNFDCYQYGNGLSGTVVSSTSQSVTIAASQYTTDMTPSYFGQVVLEFSSGPIYSTCRNVLNTVAGSGQVVINFQTPLAIQPNVGDTFRIYNRQAISTTNIILPIATSSSLGAIIVGPTLQVGLDGTLNINPTSVPVTSVNGLIGAVELTASNIPGFATVATTGSYTDLINKPAPYALPIASPTVLGGIKVPASNNHLQITSAGTLDLSFDPVKTVNNQTPDPTTGNVVIAIPVIPPPQVGLVNPTLIGATDDLNTYVTPGLFYTPAVTTIVDAPESNIQASLEVVPATGDNTGLGQRWTSVTGVFTRTRTNPSWSPWVLLANDALVVHNSTINAPNGVAGVGAGPNPAAPDYSYVSARLGVKNVLIGDLVASGNWNASTGAATPYDANDYGTQTLVTGGLISLNIGTPSVPNVVTTAANGRIYMVAIAGTTNLDGVVSWSVGDLAVAFNGAWIKLTQYANPMTQAADLVVGGSAGTPLRLAVGIDGQVLTASGGNVVWATAASFANPMTTYGDMISADPSGNAIRLPIGTVGQVLTAVASSATVGAPMIPVWEPATPMTALGDIIYGGDALGTATRLAAGTTGQVLQIVAGIPAWGTDPAASPITTQGDLVIGNSSGLASRLALGSAGQVLTVVGSTASWTALPSSLANPMTTTGDVIYSADNSGTPARQGIGSTNQVLTVIGGLPTWAAAVGFANPMTGGGDLIAGGSGGAPIRVAAGTTGQVLTMTSGTAMAWQAPSGFANPMTAGGDILIGGSGGSPTKVAIGTTGQVLTVSSGAPVWAALPAPNLPAFYLQLGGSGQPNGGLGNDPGTGVYLPDMSKGVAINGLAVTFGGSGNSFLTLPSGTYQVIGWGNMRVTANDTYVIPSQMTILCGAGVPTGTSDYTNGAMSVPDFPATTTNAFTSGANFGTRSFNTVLIGGGTIALSYTKILGSVSSTPLALQGWVVFIKIG